jgi:hypothetical protein
MPIEETVDSLDGVAEEYQDLYVEQEDGTYKVDVTGLKSAYQKEMNKRKRLEKQIKSKDEPDDSDLKLELDKANNTIKEMKVNSAVKAAALEAGVDAKHVEDVMTLTKGNFGLDEGGQVIHLDADGEPSGKSIGKFFQNDFKASKGIYYTGSGRSGSGAQQQLDGGRPLSFEGKLDKAKQSGNMDEYINLKMSKIKK